MRGVMCWAVGIAAFALAACLFLAPASAWGDAPTDKDRAREFAQEAADLLDAQKYPEALEAANKAESLYHAVYHLYVVARSLEGLGESMTFVDTEGRPATGETGTGGGTGSGVRK